MDKSAAHCRAKLTNAPIRQMHLFGLWEEAGGSGIKKKHANRQKKNMQSPKVTNYIYLIFKLNTFPQYQS